jgi:hypothetical protein
MAFHEFEKLAITGAKNAVSEGVTMKQELVTVDFAIETAMKVIDGAKGRLSSS